MLSKRITLNNKSRQQNDNEWLKGDAINVMKIYSGELMHTKTFWAVEHAICKLSFILRDYNDA